MRSDYYENYYKRKNGVSSPYLGIVLYIVQYVLLCKEKWANNANKIVEVHVITITFYFRQLGT